MHLVVHTLSVFSEAGRVQFFDDCKILTYASFLHEHDSNSESGLSVEYKSTFLQADKLKELGASAYYSYCVLVEERTLQ